MLCVDVNILVYSHRPESPDHDAYRAWLDQVRRGAEPVGLTDMVTNGFLRVVTNPRIFADPTPLDVAIDFVDACRRSPSVRTVAPGPRHWEIFLDLCRKVGARGNLIPDAYLGAFAVEQGATWISADRGFARFPGLRWRHPLDS